MRSAVSISTAKRSSQCLLSKHYLCEFEAFGCKRTHHFFLKPTSKRLDQFFRQQQKHEYEKSTVPFPSLWLFISRWYSSSSSSATAPVESTSSNILTQQQHPYQQQKQRCSSDTSNIHLHNFSDLQKLFHDIDTCPKIYANRYRLLRTALYKLRYNDADEAWLIYEKMMQCKVHKQLKANHYGHLLNVLKCGDPRHLPHMLTIIKNMEELKSAKPNQYPNMRHHSQVLYGMARHGRVQEAYDYLQQLIKKANDDKSRQTPYPTPNLYYSLALALKKNSERSSGTGGNKIDFGLLTRVTELMMEAMGKHAIQLDSKTLSVMIHTLSSHNKYIRSNPVLTTTNNVNLIEDETKKVDSLLYQLLQTSDQMYAKVITANNKRPAGNHPYNAYVYTSLITAFAQRSDMKRAQRIFDGMLKHGIKPSKYTYGALIDGYGRAGELTTAMELLKTYDERYLHPNQVILSSLLVNAIRHQHWALAEELDKRIRRKFQVYQLDPFTKTATLWLETKRNIEGARHCFGALCGQSKKETNRILVNMLLEGYGSNRDKKQLLDAYTLLKDSDKEDNRVASSRKASTDERRTRHHLIHGLFNCRDVKTAIYTFLAMRKETIPDDITLAMVIQGLVVNNQPKLAYDLFKTLQDEGIEPNLHAYTSVFNALSRLKTDTTLEGITTRRTSKRKRTPSGSDISTEFDSEEPSISSSQHIPTTTITPTTYNSKDISAEAIHLFQRLTGFRQPNIHIYTTLISCLAKTDLMEAVRIFDDMCTRQIRPTVQIYTSLIQGSAAFRNKRTALKIYQHMREQRIAPNSVTWHYLLKALVRSRADKDIIEKVVAYKDGTLQPQDQRSSLSQDRK